MGKANSQDALSCTYDAGSDKGLFYSGMPGNVTCTSANSPGYDPDAAEETPFINCYLGLFNNNVTMAFASS